MLDFEHLLPSAVCRGLLGSAGSVALLGRGSSSDKESSSLLAEASLVTAWVEGPRQGKVQAMPCLHDQPLLG